MIHDTESCRQLDGIGLLPSTHIIACQGQTDIIRNGYDRSGTDGILVADKQKCSKNQADDKKKINRCAKKSMGKPTEF
ncbi:hypothetical protein CVD23_07810 [Bacillus sp. V33-4]|nr:hypothetical protein CVD23_07810 [Bacillus sp. V33-4]